MHTIDFIKATATGNDFVVINNVSGNYSSFYKSLSDLAKMICDRKYGVGADGMLLLESSDKADVRMRIFNPDGSEADMCGNGARCAAKYYSFMLSTLSCKPIKIETRAGILEAIVKGEFVKLKMSDPDSIRLKIQLTAYSLQLTANYINTGVPHIVLFVDDLDNTEVEKLGRAIRYHKEFAPQGANVNFVKVLGKDSIAVRTYERGVEAETLACGTGSTASALIYALEADNKSDNAEYNRVVNVITKSGEKLKVSFEKNKTNFINVFLEGSARIIYRGSLVTA